MLDLILLTEFLSRVEVKTEHTSNYEPLHSIYSLLAFMFKAPLFPAGTNIVNSLFKQRLAIENFFRALLGLAPQTELQWDAYLKPKGSGASLSS
jgi:myo-inositol-1-phosphate synthase